MVDYLYDYITNRVKLCKSISFIEEIENTEIT